MAYERMTLGEALGVLEINSTDGLTEESLAKQKRKAYIRWHPDKVAHKGDSRLLELYTAKTQLIEPAAQLVGEYLKGEYDPAQKFDDTNVTYAYEEPLEVLRRNAPMMQAEISKVWGRVQEMQFLKSEEEVVLSEGHKLEELMKDDLQSDIVPTGITQIFQGFACAMVVALIGAIFSIFSARWGGIIIGIANFGFPLHLLVCLLGMLPMARFWLPSFLATPIEWYRNALLALLPESGGFWTFVAVVGMLVGYIVKYVLIYPLYFLATALVGDKVVRRVVQKQTYYANLASWYIEQLIGTNAQTLSEEQLFHLSHAYSTLTKVPQQ